MSIKRRSFLVAGSALLAAGMVMPLSAAAKERVVFSGGPAGGTFQVVANAIQVYDPIKDSKTFRVRAQSSAGSVENLRKVNSGRAQMGVVYSGHVYLGRNGRMKNDTNKYENVMAVAWLYGAPAQLVVRKGSGQEGRCRQCRVRRVRQLRVVLHPHGHLGQDRAQRDGL